MHKAQSDRSEGRLALDMPHSCRFKAHNRALGRRLLLCAVVLLLGATAGHPQWLETKVTLPDTLGGATWPTCLTTDTSERYVYIGDRGGAVYIVDTKARTRVAKIPCGDVSAICTNTRRNKVYAADYVGDNVLAISCATNQMIATVPMGAKPFAVCYNSTDDKTYVASFVNGESGSLTVIDCSSDSVVATMHVGAGQPSLCYNPAGNRVFCATADTLLVIDGAGDSVVAACDGEWWGTMIVNAVADKVYLGFLALDGTTGEVLDTLWGGGSMICLNSHTQKLYSIDQNVSKISVFDCAADTIVAEIRPVYVENVFSLACDTIADRIYVACNAVSTPRDVILVIDGVADTMTARIPGPVQGRLLASSKLGRMYSADLGGQLAVYDTGTDSLLRTIFIGGQSDLMCYDSIDDKVYYASRSVLGEVGAIDAATNQPIGHVQVGPYPQDIVWHAPTNRVYCGGAQDITIIDPTADTVTKVLPVPGYLLCSAPRLNRVYAISGTHKLTVIDCRNDSVTKTIVIPTNGALSMCYVAYDKLYIGGAGTGALSIIDCVGDSLIRSYPFANTLVAAGRERKQVYCARPYSLCTFDAAGDTLVVEVPWDASDGVDMLYASSLNRVYCVRVNGHCIQVADGETDSAITQIPIPVPYPISLGYDSTSGLVYCGHELDSIVTFIDSRTDSVVGSGSTGLIARTFVPVPAHNRVYVGGYGNSFIQVIRTDPPGVNEVTSPCTKNAVRPTVLSRRSPLVVHQPCDLLDAAGRKVLDLQPGANDVRALAPGVYFVRGPETEDGRPAGIRKVVVTR
jgi:YVTN family beta-propeller protein